MSKMFLAGISIHSLSMRSRRLIGRSISPTEISNVTSELSIYASSKKKAFELYDSFVLRWKQNLASAVACLDRSLGSCLTFSITLRTTNVIERLNKEFVIALWFLLHCEWNYIGDQTQ